MKIAMVQSHLTGSGFWGGVLLARQIATGLAAAGHDVHAVELMHDSSALSTPLDSFVVHHLAAAPMLQGINPLWAWYPHESDVATAQTFLSNLGPDVVYGHMVSENTAILEAAIRLGLPIVHHVHDFACLCARSFLVDETDRPCPGPTSQARCEECLRAGHPPAMQIGMRIAAASAGETAIRALLGRSRTERFRLHAGVQRFFTFSRRYLDSVASWIATGPRIRDFLCRYGVVADRVTILPHSLPDDRLQQSPAPPPLVGRPVRIGYFGRISPEKGVDLLADALRDLASQSSRSFEWWVISGSVSPEDRRELQKRSGLPNDRIRFVEGLRGVDLNAVIAQLDLCVVPSLWLEIGPLTLLEALAQGVPCVCNDTAGHAHLVQDGVNGFLFRSGDQADLTRKLARCLADDAALDRLRGHPCPVAPFAGFVDRIATILDEARDPANRSLA